MKENQHLLVWSRYFEHLRKTTNLEKLRQPMEAEKEFIMDAIQQPLLPAIPIANLVLGNSMQSITVRLMRSWEARNFNRNGELMSFDLLLLDQEDSAIHASIHHRILLSFKSFLKEGKIFTISNFQVLEAYERYKVSDNDISIRFTAATTICEVPETSVSIKNQVFRLYTYPKFLTLANTNLQLPDVVGQILSIQGPNLNDATSKQKIVLLLLLQEKSTVRVTIWDDQASEFRRLYNLAGRKAMVIICTCLNPKLFAGTLYLNSTGATKFYIDETLNVIKEFMTELGINGASRTPAIEDNSSSSIGMETWNIHKIMDYITAGNLEEKEIVCCAKIMGISARNGWYYVSCAKCSKKLGRAATSFVCNVCNNQNAVGVVKFRVELDVDDGSRRSKFVIFDRDARKLTNTTAEELNESKVLVPETEPSSEEIPLCIRDLVGKSFKFQLKITKFNFTARFQTFTITRVIEEICEEMLSRPPQDKVENKNLGEAGKVDNSASMSRNITHALKNLEDDVKENSNGKTPVTDGQDLPVEETHKPKKPRKE